MIRVVIADDEPLARRRMRTLLDAHSDVEVVAECATGPDTVAATDKHSPDVLFLDIQMPGMTGIEVIDALGPGTVPLIVFVTAFDQHAIRAFEQEALDYVLKPLGEERFEATLTRVRARLNGWSPPSPEAASTVKARQPLLRIPLHNGGKITFLDVDDLEWVEADGDYVRLHAGSRSHLHRSTLSNLEQQLDRTEFVRVHRGALVRRSAIVSMEPYFHGEYVIRVRSGGRLRLSRSYRDRLSQLLG
jgi:two-component system, LytTR family, response regulator